MSRYPSVSIEKIPAPGLVELVESGKAKSPEATALLTDILAPYQGKLDALVLGCTHYPFVKDSISRILGPEVALLDGGAGTARQTARCLAQAGLVNDGPGSVTIENSLGTPEMLTLSAQLLEM